MRINRKVLDSTYKALSVRTNSRLNKAVDWIVSAKRKGDKVVAAAKTLVP